MILALQCPEMWHNYSSFKLACRISVTVQVQDMNDNSPIFTSDYYHLELPHHVMAGTVIGSVQVSIVCVWQKIHSLNGINLWLCLLTGTLASSFNSAVCSSLVSVLANFATCLFNVCSLYETFHHFVIPFEEILDIEMFSYHVNNFYEVNLRSLCFRPWTLI